MLEFDSES
jgi:hypothetical protein